MKTITLSTLKRRPRVARALLLLACGIAVFWFGLRLVPLPAELFAAPVGEVQLLDRQGHPLRMVRPQTLPFRHRLADDQIPPALAQATLAAEDRSFWNHAGVNWRAVGRAAGQNVRYGRVVSGASTITQQLIKLAHPRPRTFRTKLIEAVQALRLEQKWSKRQILAEYLNRLDYGNQSRGCAAAARFYFAKPAADLSPAECAFLAALPQAPTRLNPRRSREPAQKRQRWILGQMLRSGWLTPPEYERALAEPLRLAFSGPEFEAPHFVDWILSGDAPGGPPAGGTVKTTLDLELNRFAETVLQRHLRLLQDKNAANGAVLILDNRSREILAWVGSEDYAAPAAGQVNGVLARRSAGSTLKPFTYLLAFERGATAASIVADVPTEFPTATGLFVPANYDRHCLGPTRYRLALANSLNISAIKVLKSIGGPSPLQEQLRQCGLTTLTRSPQEYGLGLTLGNAEICLLELVNAYACLATLGEYQPIRWLLPGTRPPSSPGRRVAGREAAYLVTDILSDNLARAHAFGTQSPLRFDFPVACKTGTSSDFRDNWAIGYTPDFTVGVWVGNFDGTPMKNISGVSGAAPILHDIFNHLRDRYETTWYSVPTNLVRCSIHPLTGKRVDPNASAETVEEIFFEANLPAWEQDSDYESSTQRVVLDGEYRPWFESSDNWLRERTVLKTEPGAPSFRFPLPGTTFLLDGSNDETNVRLQLEGSAELECGSDTVSLDEQEGSWSVRLRAGHHVIWAGDRLTGRTAQTQIEVKVR